MATAEWSDRIYQCDHKIHLEKREMGRPSRVQNVNRSQKNKKNIWSLDVKALTEQWDFNETCVATETKALAGPIPVSCSPPTWNRCFPQTAEGSVNRGLGKWGGAVGFGVGGGGFRLQCVKGYSSITHDPLRLRGSFNTHRAAEERGSSLLWQIWPAG